MAQVMKRWRIRRWLVWMLVLGAGVWFLFSDKMSKGFRFGIPIGLAAVVMIFGWYDLFKEYEADDPGAKDFESELKQRREQNRSENDMH